MTKLLLSALALAASAAPALASTYRCSVQDREDYSVEINLGSGKAAFFDNNEWEIVPALKEGVSLFGRENLVIYFDEKIPDHYVNYVRFKEGRRSVRKSIACRAASELYSGI